MINGSLDDDCTSTWSILVHLGSFLLKKKGTALYMRKNEKYSALRIGRGVPISVIKLNVSTWYTQFEIILTPMEVHN